MDLKKSTATKVQQIFSAAVNGAIPQSAVTSSLNFDEQNYANTQRWLVPSYENPGFFERGPSTALAAMAEAFGQTGPNPMYPSNNTNPRPNKKKQVGDQATVVDQGKPFKGRVQSVNTDGSYTLSFDGARPSKDKFGDTELGDEEEKPGSLPHEKASDSSFKYSRF